MDGEYTTQMNKKKCWGQSDVTTLQSVYPLGLQQILADCYNCPVVTSVTCQFQCTLEELEKLFLATRSLGCSIQFTIDLAALCGKEALCTQVKTQRLVRKFGLQKS